MGLLFLMLLFVLSVILVVGVKFTSLWLKKLFPSSSKQEIVAPKPVKKRKKAKPIKSIEIDPDEVDRIYVKKVS